MENLDLKDLKLKINILQVVEKYQSEVLTRKNILFHMNSFFKYLFFLICITFIGACNNSDEKIIPDEPVVTLSASPTNFIFEAEGGTTSFDVTSNTTWRINFESSSWCKPSIQTTSGNATVNLTAEANNLEEVRSMSLTISATGTDNVILQISQAAKKPEPTISGYIEPDNTGMASDSKTLASKMFLGWNIGNTLEAIGGENAWGNPKVSNELIQAVKAAGFNAIRIPCAWNQYIEDQTTYEIKESWLARVKEVVDYCVSNDMYAVLNIHWDGGWMENNCTPDKQEAVNKKLAAIWKQIAIYFRDYDEHLLFAGANEPNAENQEQVNVLKVYMQTFVNVVRGTGGRNTYRNLIVQAPFTDIDKADQFMTLPTDATANRLLAEVHYYSPWQFCGLTEDASWGKMYYFWGAAYHITGAEGRYPNWDCEEGYLKAQFQKMKVKFVDADVPIILGEFGAVHRTITESALWQQKHDESIGYFFEQVTQEAKNHGMVPFFWDNGDGIFDRNKLTISDQLGYNGLVKGANAGKYPF